MASEVSGPHPCSGPGPRGAPKACHRSRLRAFVYFETFAGIPLLRGLPGKHPSFKRRCFAYIISLDLHNNPL